MGLREDYLDIDDEAISKWLAACYQSKGFREYVRKRDLILLKTMGTGSFDRLFLGQRFEILKLLQEVDSAYKLQNKGREANKGK